MITSIHEIADILSAISPEALTANPEDIMYLVAPPGARVIDTTREEEEEEELGDRRRMENCISDTDASCLLLTRSLTLSKIYILPFIKDLPTS